MSHLGADLPWRDGETSNQPSQLTDLVEKLHTEDLHLLEDAFRAVPLEARPDDFLEKIEALDELIRDEDPISQVLNASSVHIVMQELLEYVCGICRASRIRAIVPTVIIQDQNGLDGIIDRICLDNSLRRRAQSLQPDEAAEFMSRLVGRLRRDRTSPRRADVYKLLQDVGESSGCLPLGLNLHGIVRGARLKSGGEADVYHGELSGSQIILRDVRLDTNKDAVLKYIRQEVLVTCVIAHPNILPFIGIWSDSQHPLSIVTPFAENGEARFLLEARPDQFIHIAQGTASAVRFLHESKPPLYHGDIRGSNILLSANCDALLSDFGLSKLRHEVTRTFSRNSDSKEGGSVRYLAPELFAADTIRLTAASDRYALAMTFLELVTLDRPFAEISNEFAVIGAVRDGQRPRRPPRLGALSPWQGDLLWELLESIWRHEPSQRLSMPDIEDFLATLNTPTDPASGHAPHERLSHAACRNNEDDWTSWSHDAVSSPDAQGALVEDNNRSAQLPLTFEDFAKNIARRRRDKQKQQPKPENQTEHPSIHPSESASQVLGTTDTIDLSLTSIMLFIPITLDIEHLPPASGTSWVQPKAGRPDLWEAALQEAFGTTGSYLRPLSSMTARPSRGSPVLWCKERDHWLRQYLGQKRQLLELEASYGDWLVAAEGPAPTMTISALQQQCDAFLQRLRYSNDRHLLEVYRANLIMAHLDIQTASRVFFFEETTTRDDGPYDTARHVWNDSDDSLQRLFESFRDLDIALIVSIGRYSRSASGRNSKVPVVAAAGGKKRESIHIDWEAERKRLDEEGRRALRAVPSDVDDDMVKLCFSWFDVERRCKMQEHIDSLRKQCASRARGGIVSTGLRQWKALVQPTR